MVYYFTLSIFLLPIVTILGSQFWRYEDFIHNALSDPQDVPEEPTPEAHQRFISLNEMDENQVRRRERLSRGFLRKNVTLTSEEAEIFKQAVIIDESYPQNIPLAVIKHKLLALGNQWLHEWFDIDVYDLEKYTKYWGKVCLYFQNIPMERKQRFQCSVAPSYAVNKKRLLTISGKIHYLDLLNCKCRRYEINTKNPVTAPDTFLIHKSSQNEYYVFDQNMTNTNRFDLIIRDFKGGVTLPVPVSKEQNINSSLVYFEKSVTVCANDLAIFNRSVTVEKLYPENVSMVELEDKLMEFGEIHHWPELHKYKPQLYYMYWANVCLFLWGQPLRRTQRQLCILSASYGFKKIRKLFMQGRKLYFDLLYCRCHSYMTNCMKPISNVDTFLINRSGEDEYFIFEQRETNDSSYTLFIKDFKRVNNLPDPELFKDVAAGQEF